MEETTLKFQPGGAAQLTYSTVRLECFLKNGSRSIGTAFFYAFAETGTTSVPALVTNHHVVKDAIEARIHFALAGPDGPKRGEYFTYTLSGFHGHWFAHPNPEVDLCIIPMVQLIQHAQSVGMRLFFVTLESALIPSHSELNELDAVEDVLMIGYPNGIWDSVNNRPIVRRGITATHPGFDYNGQKEFMIDAACFPGSSGSPVFLYNRGTHPHKLGGIALGSRIKLLGVLRAGPQYSAEGQIEIVDIPTVQKSIVVSDIPINLGIVIKSERITDFEPLVAERLQRSAPRQLVRGPTSEPAAT